MIRFMMGLSIACLLVGCGDAATETADEATDAPAPAATDGAATEAPAGDTEVAATEEPAQETAPAEMMTVKFKVPGMT
jgi:hypothetical protein